jgi:hypothetical protein
MYGFITVLASGVSVRVTNCPNAVASTDVGLSPKKYGLSPR